jgi:hypothetical protein
MNIGCQSFNKESLSLSGKRKRGKCDNVITATTGYVVDINMRATESYIDTVLVWYEVAVEESNIFNSSVCTAGLIYRPPTNIYTREILQNVIADVVQENKAVKANIRSAVLFAGAFQKIVSLSSVQDCISLTDDPDSRLLALGLR